ncbi:uncharacterized protein LOC126788949 [Argentina anserina]|uniref:uncharacterized protein LOC126788949 n=1 Tax=Argentina anserina TaxID=57926 RepID=UPI0021765CC9|nr:uncharacterized protein LOC126788949 [Potentilla anserina]
MGNTFKCFELLQNEYMIIVNVMTFVKVHSAGRLQDGKDLLKVHEDREEPSDFKIDATQIIEGLNKAVVTMKKGEITLLFIISEYAIGVLEDQMELVVVPSNSTSCKIELAVVLLPNTRKLRLLEKNRGENSPSMNIMAGSNNGRTFEFYQSAYISIQVHVEVQIGMDQFTKLVEQGLMSTFWDNKLNCKWLLELQFFRRVPFIYRYDCSHIFICNGSVSAPLFCSCMSTFDLLLQQPYNFHKNSGHETCVIGLEICHGYNVILHDDAMMILESGIAGGDKEPLLVKKIALADCPIFSCFVLILEFGAMSSIICNFHYDLWNGDPQLQLLLSYVIMLEVGEQFTTWELLHTRGGYSERECLEVLTKTNEMCVAHAIIPQENANFAYEATEQPLFPDVISQGLGISTSADDYPRFFSHALGDDSNAALHGSDTTILGLLNMGATAFAFAQMMLRFAGTRMIMSQLISGDITCESLESVLTQNVKLEDKFLLRGK